MFGVNHRQWWVLVGVTLVFAVQRKVGSGAAKFLTQLGSKRRKIHGLERSRFERLVLIGLRTSYTVCMIEVFAEDQYAIVSGEVTLPELEAALPQDLQYRAPRLPLSLQSWLLSGGVGLLESPPVRKDVLGLTYHGAHFEVSVGGRVVKNVAGYDAVRLLIGSDSSLERGVKIKSAFLRLRPKMPVVRLEMLCSHADFEELRQLGAAYGVAYKTGSSWCLRAEFWGAAPMWGTPVQTDLDPALELYDALGVFPRPKPALSDLETRVLAAL
jgi:hypothetical protein